MKGTSDGAEWKEENTQRRPRKHANAPPARVQSALAGEQSAPVGEQSALSGVLIRFTPQMQGVKLWPPHLNDRVPDPA